MKTLALVLALLALLAPTVKATSFSASCAPDQVSILCPQTIVEGSTTTWSGQNTWTQGLTLPDGTVLTSTAGLGGGETNTFTSSKTFTNPNFSIGGSTFSTAFGNVGIGTVPTAASNLFTVMASSAIIRTDSDGNSSGLSPLIYHPTLSGVGAGMFARSARGTRAAPLAVANGDQISVWNVRAYDGTNFGNPQANITMLAVGPWTTISKGTRISFVTTSSGTTTGGTRMTIADGGNVGIGTTLPTTLLDVSGTASFGSGALKSTFSTTGSLTLGAAATITGTSSITASGFFGDINATSNYVNNASSTSTSSLSVASLTAIQVSTQANVNRGGRPLIVLATILITNSSAGTRIYTVELEENGVAISNQYTASVTSGNSTTMTLHGFQLSSTTGTQTYTIAVNSNNVTGTQTANARRLTILEF